MLLCQLPVGVTYDLHIDRTHMLSINIHYLIVIWSPYSNMNPVKPIMLGKPDNIVANWLIMLACSPTVYQLVLLIVPFRMKGNVALNAGCDPRPLDNFTVLRCFLKWLQQVN